ncbi:hypothetical protein BMF94_6883 [Rhodotorula taiwanensis]|uniref:Lipid droplet-associated perilipin protein n=1 Tax=Rhodotorula taiwanensis TaxID=741276 RepID=A0A2S5B006_9BASI|nr:hypothetical protein BMF94_6883 [Rhodotorula taiwanensis]
MSIQAVNGDSHAASEKQSVAQHDTALHRVTDYPLVKDTLSTAHDFVERRPYLNSLYSRTLSLSLAILHRLEPLQKRLPLETADGYANSALDVVEKYVPQVKMQTGELLGLARQPADKAYGRANDLKEGLQQHVPRPSLSARRRGFPPGKDRISPVTEQVHQRIQQSQSQLSALQERLKKQIPHDQESLKHTLDSILAEVDSLVKSVQTIPSHAQQTAKPYLDGMYEASEHIKKEITRTDVPLGTKASNVLAYSQEKLGPVIEQIQHYLLKKKDESAQTAEDVKDKAEDKVDAATSDKQ